jgi:hypothetical protein
LAADGARAARIHWNPAALTVADAPMMAATIVSDRPTAASSDFGPSGFYR